jgi:hypothetical protein
MMNTNSTIGTANNLIVTLNKQDWPYAVDGLTQQLQQALTRHQQAEPHFDLTVLCNGQPIVVELFLPSATFAELELLPKAQERLEATAQDIANTLQRPVRFMLSKGEQMSVLIKADITGKIWSLTQKTAFGKAQQAFVAAAAGSSLVIDEVVASLNQLSSLASRLQGDAIVIYRDDSGVVAAAPDEISVQVQGNLIQVAWQEGNMDFELGYSDANNAYAVQKPTPIQPSVSAQIEIIGFIESDGIRLQLPEGTELQSAPAELQQTGIESMYPVSVFTPVTPVFGRNNFNQPAALDVKAKTQDGQILPALAVGFSRAHLEFDISDSAELRVTGCLSDIPVMVIRNNQFEVISAGDVIALDQTHYLKAGITLLKIAGEHHA